MMHGGTWMSLGSWVASLMFVVTLFQQIIPYSFQRFFNKYIKKIEAYFNPYIQITFQEYFCNELSDRERITAYLAIQQYLEANSLCTAKRLKANSLRNSQTDLVLSMDDYEEIADEYQGITVWWCSKTIFVRTSRYQGDNEPQRYYTLSFHGRYRDLITRSYMKHVLTEGKAKSVNNRKRKLYTNRKQKSWSSIEKSRWISVAFEHPATFETLALDPELKKDIMDDLISFSKAKV